MTTTVQDWAGSAAQRRPQGVCRAPKPQGPVQCEWIPAGTPVTIRRRSGPGQKWKRYTTRIDLQIKATVKRTPKSLMFTEGNWTVAVALRHVRPAHEFNGSLDPLVGRSV